MPVNSKKTTKISKKTVKKPVSKATKSAPAKSVKRSTVRVKKQPVVKSFQVSPPNQPFFTFRVTQDTLYWLILSMFVIALALWVLDISVKVNRIYDQIEATNISNDSMIMHTSHNKMIQNDVPVAE